MKTHFKATFAVAILSAGLAGAEPLYRCPMTVTGYAGTETLTNMPVLVRISRDIDQFDYNACAEDGADISFASSDGTVVYPHEIDTWNPNGESLVWVRLPELSGTDTGFLFRWGDSAPPAVVHGETWEGYAGVWHLNDATDSTTNAAVGTMNAKAVQRAGGAVGGAWGMTVSGVNGPLVSVACGDAICNVVTGAFTVSGWVKFGAAPNWAYIFSRKAGDASGTWGTQFRGSSGQGGDFSGLGVYPNGGCSVCNTSGKFGIGPWTKYDVVYNGTSASVYVNGKFVSSATLSAQAQNDGSKTLGISGMASASGHGTVNGDTDEFRILCSAISADRSKADYDTVTKSGFVTSGKTQVAEIGDAALFVLASPTAYGAADPGWGLHSDRVAGTEYTCTVDGETVFDGGDSKAVAVRWEVTGTDGGAIASGTGATAKYVHNQASYLKWFFDVYHKTTVTAGAGGSVRIDGGEAFHLAGSTCTVIAEPDPGYALLRWEGRGLQAEQRTQETLSFTVEGGAELVAVFAPVRDVATAADLVAAVADASQGPNVIRVAEGLYDLSEQLSLTRDVRVVGAGAERTVIRIPSSVAAAANHRVAYLNHANAVLERVTLTGGHTSTDRTSGMGVKLDANGGLFCDAIVSNNYAVSSWHQRGGGVAIEGANGLVARCLITDNRIGIGGTEEYGGGVYMTAGRLVGCTVTGNRVSSRGAGVYASGMAVVEDCAITSNRIVLATSNSIENNLTTYGGGIFFAGDQVTVVRSAIFDNGDANRNGYRGSPDWFFSKTVEPPVELFTDCTFVNPLRPAPRTEEIVLTEDGGVTLAEALNSAVDGMTITLGEGTFELTGELIVDKGVTIAGAGADRTTVALAAAAPDSRVMTVRHADAKVTGLTLTGGHLSENSGFGCGVLVTGPGGTVADCRITGNKSLYWHQKGSGVAILSLGGRVTRCQIDGNVMGSTSQSNGRCWGAGAYVSGGLLDNCLVRDNVTALAASTENNGGGVYATGLGRVVNCTVVGNTGEEKGGGVYAASDDGYTAQVVNCAIYDNLAPNDSSTGAPDWFAASGCANAFVGCASKVAPNATCVSSAAPNFVGGGDYRLGTGSPLVGAGVAHDDVDTVDLVGAPRVPGSVDIGCYAYDRSKKSFGFTVSPEEFRPGDVATLSAVMENMDGYSVTWTITVPGKDFSRELSGEEVTFDTQAVGAYYTICATATKAGEETFSETKADAIKAIPWTVCAAPNGRSLPPYATMADAATNALDAAALLTDGMTLEIGAGTNLIAQQISVTCEATVRGAGVDVTVVKLDPSVAASPYTRIFRLANANAVVSNLTCAAARLGQEQWCGCGVLIEGAGGTLVDCRVTGSVCKDTGWHNKGGGVAVTSSGGVVRRCIIDNNTLNVNKTSQHSGGGVYMTKGLVEDSLIWGNTTCEKGGGVCMDGGTLRNCTVVNNTSTMDNGCSGVRNSNGTVENCVMWNNIGAAGDNFVGAPNWMSSGTAKFSHCAAPAAVGTDCVTADPLFEDPANGNWRPDDGSPLIDKGNTLEGDAWKTDLGGLARLQGKATDIGCYEYDASKPSFGFGVEPARVKPGEAATLTAIVQNLDGYAISWTVSAHGGDWTTNLTGAAVEIAIDRPGFYDVRGVATKAGEPSFEKTVESAFRVVPDVLYASPTGGNVPPYASPETAATDANDAAALLEDGMTLMICPGTNIVEQQLLLTKEVTVAGYGMDVSVLALKKGVAATPWTRLLQLDNKQALVRDLTLSGARLGQERYYGASVWIAANGGTLQDCRVTGTVCEGNVGWHNMGAVAITSADGVVRRCVIDHNRLVVALPQSNSDHFGGGVYMSNGILESSLVYSNETSRAGGGVYMTGGKMRNCTVVGNRCYNSSERSGGIWHSGGDVVNCIFRDNIGNGTGTGCEPDVKTSHPEKFTSCAAPVAVGTDCVTADPLFRAAAKCDWRLKGNSPCVDKGRWDEWMDGSTTLGGQLRAVPNKHPDIGCYERFIPGLMLLVR